MFIAIDLETDLTRPGCKVPEPVCMSWAIEGRPAEFTDGGWRSIREQVLALLAADPDSTFIGHNIAFDFAVLSQWCGLYEEVEDLYRESRVLDTMIWHRLAASADCVQAVNSYIGLDRLAQILGLPVLEKPEEIRTSFGQFLPSGIVPPGPHRDYSVKDADVLLQILERAGPRWPDWFARGSGPGLAWTHFALTLQSAWGLRTSPNAVEIYRSDAEAEVARLGALAWQHGFHRCKVGVVAKRKLLGPEATKASPGPYLTSSDVSEPPMGCQPSLNTKALQEAVAAAYGASGRTAPTTDSGAVGRSSQTLLESGDPTLVDLALLGKWSKALGTDVPLLAEDTVHTRYGFARTGRTTSSQPNLQNTANEGVRRNDGTKGLTVRHCFRPRDGNCFIDCDFPSLEVHTLAESMLQKHGLRQLADHILAGQASGSGFDPHSLLGATLVGISYEDFKSRYENEPELKKVRKRVKPCTFGFPVGMSPNTFVQFCAGQGVSVTVQEAKELKALWQRTFPENAKTLELLKSSARWDTGLFDTVIFGSGVELRNGTFCGVANAEFQGLGADVGGRACRILSSYCYSTRWHGTKWEPLYGCRPVLFVHDQILTEVPLDRVDECATLIEDAMQDAGVESCPTVGAGLRPKAIATSVWCSEAKRITDPKTGKLLVWHPPTK